MVFAQIRANLKKKGYQDSLAMEITKNGESITITNKTKR